MAFKLNSHHAEHKCLCLSNTPSIPRSSPAKCFSTEDINHNHYLLDAVPRDTEDQSTLSTLPVSIQNSRLTYHDPAGQSSRTPQIQHRSN
ncbi:uncharacterized protein MYCGRDRAFT_105657 [Zymoseptoria tritici IPO323]|uniref:Uncharacterized protein n=1 Tax=Zymoseptoria tritici (strain CBS 115943 / IPO323) TaxID=336722 RepID=F9XJ31_ZYMTI|nr:uncharacterized protein MYCGRDRAFT_105657 [Zymoseptoria tritici IPO323]EGP84789.1 hypothetical protein MYCGRDRAFT_105657 [Zymoseptoria tritici IPO323]